MDKRLIKLLSTRSWEIRGGQMLDTYNQQIHNFVSCTIRTNINTANHHFIVMEEPQVLKYRIRKLTPRECFRLMGVDDADIDKIQAAGISNSQQYKMAGNSIVVDNLFYIFRNLFTN